MWFNELNEIHIKEIFKKKKEREKDLNFNLHHVIVKKEYKRKGP